MHVVRCGSGHGHEPIMLKIDWSCGNDRSRGSRGDRTDRERTNRRLPRIMQLDPFLYDFSGAVRGKEVGEETLDSTYNPHAIKSL